MFIVVDVIMDMDVVVVKVMVVVMVMDPLDEIFMVLSLRISLVTKSDKEMIQRIRMRKMLKPMYVIVVELKIIGHTYVEHPCILLNFINNHSKVKEKWLR